MPDSILMTSDAVGGVFTYAVALASALAADRVTVHLAMMGPFMRAEQRATVRRIPNLVLHEGAFDLEWMDDPWEDVARAGDWLLALERRLAPDVVHLNGYAHAVLPFRAPVVTVAHSCVASWWEAVHGELPPGDRLEPYRRAVTAGLDAADEVVAVSQAMATSLERHYGCARATVVHDGLEIPPPRAVAAVAKESFILTAGRLSDAAKNAAAVHRVEGRVPWAIAFVGEDTWVRHDTLLALMEHTSICALPARYEPFGLTALEAAARGNALVLGAIDSQREIWGDAARYVDPDDHHELARVLTELAKDALLRQEMASAARRRAAHFTSARMAEAMTSIYDAAIARRRCA